MPSVSNKLTVKLGARSYDILIGKGLLKSAGMKIHNTVGNGKIVKDNQIKKKAKVTKNSKKDAEQSELTEDSPKKESKTHSNGKKG